MVASNDNIPLRDDVLLCAELIDAYALLANWQAKHRAEFPRHRVSVELVCTTEPGDRAFDCSICVTDEEHNKVLYVSQHADSATRAAGEARLGAEIVVAESREGWR